MTETEPGIVPTEEMIEINNNIRENIKRIWRPAFQENEGSLSDALKIRGMATSMIGLSLYAMAEQAYDELVVEFFGDDDLELEDGRKIGEVYGK